MSTAPINHQPPAGEPDEPKLWVQLQVVFPPERGGKIVTKTVEMSDDEYIPKYGRGVDAMIDMVARQVKNAIRS
jgi:hypothetical protein